MLYTINNGTLEVTVDSFGAELTSVKLFGKEKLWQNEDGSWNGHAPVLFPFCGRSAPIIDGKRYDGLKMHGLARYYEFSLLEKTDEKLSLLFLSTQETEKLFPYPFRFVATFEVIGNTLKTEYAIENPSENPIYAACGSHESYALPEGFENYCLEFDDDEDLTTLIHHQTSGKMVDGKKTFGYGKILPLPTEFLEELTAIFANLKGRAVTLKKNSGEKIARVTFDDFSYLMLWHPKKSNMICIEPWTALPDYHDAERDGDFSKKTGVYEIEAGKCKTFTHEITYF